MFMEARHSRHFPELAWHFEVVDSSHHTGDELRDPGSRGPGNRLSPLATALRCGAVSLGTALFFLSFDIVSVIPGKDLPD